MIIYYKRDHFIIIENYQHKKLIDDYINNIANEKI